MIDLFDISGKEKVFAINTFGNKKKTHAQVKIYFFLYNHFFIFLWSSFKLKFTPRAYAFFTLSLVSDIDRC